MVYLGMVVILSRWFSEHWNVIDNDDNDASLEGCEQEPSPLREFQHSPHTTFYPLCTVGDVWWTMNG